MRENPASVGITQQRVIFRDLTERISILPHNTRHSSLETFSGRARFISQGTYRYIISLSHSLMLVRLKMTNKQAGVLIDRFLFRGR